MTSDQQKEYNKLSSYGRSVFDSSFTDFPDWDFKQRMTNAIVCERLAGKFGPDDENGIWKAVLEVLENLDSYMQRNFPNLYPQVKDTISNLYNRFKNWVGDVFDFLRNLF